MICRPGGIPYLSGSSGHRQQSIHICYDLVGFLPLDTLMKQEMTLPEDHAIPGFLKLLSYEQPPFARDIFVIRTNRAGIDCLQEV